MFEIASATSSTIAFLDSHEGAATVLVTSILVLITFFYSIFTFWMVLEMRRTRSKTIEPSLIVMKSSLFEDGGTVKLHFKNMGFGPALQAGFTLEYDNVVKHANVVVIHHVFQHSSRGEISAKYGSTHAIVGIHEEGVASFDKLPFVGSSKEIHYRIFFSDNEGNRLENSGAFVIYRQDSLPDAKLVSVGGSKKL